MSIAVLSTYYILITAGQTPLYFLLRISDIGMSDPLDLEPHQNALARTHSFFFALSLHINGNASFAKPLRFSKSTIMKSSSGFVHICFSSFSNLLTSLLTPAPMVTTRTPRDFITSACSKAMRKSCALPSVNIIKTSLTPGLSPSNGLPVKTYEHFAKKSEFQIITSTQQNEKKQNDCLQSV